VRDRLLTRLAEVEALDGLHIAGVDEEHERLVEDEA